MSSESIRGLEDFGFQMAERVETIKSGLFTTQNPLDENSVLEKINALKELVDEFILMVDYIENTDVYADPEEIKDVNVHPSPTEEEQ
jgi:hypothetical protein